MFLDEFDLHMDRHVKGGASGGVYMCTRRSDKQLCAVKLLTDCEMSREEIEIHRQCAAAAPLNVVGVEAVYSNEALTLKSVTYKYALVLEFMPHGDLFSFLELNKGPLGERVTAQIISSAACGIAVVHALGISYRDIKLENFMLVRPNDSESMYSVKLTDFGLSTRRSNPKTPTGTGYYVAPEVVRTIDANKLAQAAIKSPSYDKRCDMWGLGVCMFMLLGNYAPFRSDIPNVAITRKMLQQIADGQWSFTPADRWRNISDAAKNIIKRLLVVDPDLRLNAVELISELQPLLGCSPSPGLVINTPASRFIQDNPKDASGQLNVNGK
jgi:serine/threonine protein kinase